MSGIHSLSNENRSDDGKDMEEISQSGSTSATSVIRPADLVRAAKNQGLGPVDQLLCSITLYRNGFIVQDGEFRSAHDPQNHAFLEQLRRGEVPEELEKLAREKFGDSRNVGVNLINKVQEDFIPEKKFKAFTGEGNTMGKSSLSAVGSLAEAPAQEIIISDTEKSAIIRVVLHNGEKHTIKVLPSTSVLQLYQHVKFLSGYEKSFDLLGGFPPKPLTDPLLSVKDAGLIGSAVRQKI